MLGGGNKRKIPHMDTLVGHNTKIVGDIHFEGGLHVDGLIEGNVNARDAGSRLSISERGQVQGEVRVPEVMLNGMVKGDVYASERVELGAKAKVEGNVYYNLIRMEAGATVNGRGDQPNMHDILTGSQADGTAFPPGEDRTCKNYTSSGEGAVMVGHHDRMGPDDSPPAKSWNASHPSRGGCSQDALRGTGGAGLFYCFAAN